MMEKKWTSIAVRNNTHDTLEQMKRIKSPGKLENFDDVIRRGMNIPNNDSDLEESSNGDPI
jgi:hypothetical protein